MVKKKLLDIVRDKIRFKHYSLSTEKTYVFEDALAVIERIGSSDPHLAAALRRLIDVMDFDSLQKLLNRQAQLQHPGEKNESEN